MLKTLILSGKDIRKLVNVKDAVKAIENAFLYFGKGKTQMPPKLYIDLKKFNGDFRAMPGYIEGLQICTLKWVNVHPDNRKKGLPSVMGITVVSDVKNGLPLCIMDATYATALRTGAAGGVAVKYLARKDSSKVALVGCGVQAKTQLLAIVSILKIKEVNVWGIRQSEAKAFISKTKIPNVKMRVIDTVKDCVKDCDIVVTTTPSRKPLIKLDWLKKGVHINAIGADAKGKQELEYNILKKAKIVVDSFDQASHSGEINVCISKKKLTKKDIYSDIGQIVAKIKKGRTNNNEITIFDSTGLAIQDTAIANLIYKKTKLQKRGQYIDIVKC